MRLALPLLASLIALPLAAEPLRLPPLPADAPPGAHGIERVVAAPDGSAVFVIRRDGGHPFAYELLALAPGAPPRPLWRGQDPCCAGPSGVDIALGPRGQAALLWPGNDGTHQYRLFGGRAPTLPANGWTGGRYSADGAFLGGALGAFASDGHRLAGPLPEWRSIEDALVAPGPTPDTLRFVRGGVRYRWDGRGAPEREGAWPCARVAAGRDLSAPAPGMVRFSPDGRFVVWGRRDQPERALVCDSHDGRELLLQAAPGVVDFSNATTVVYAARGALWQRSLPGGPEEPVPTPGASDISAVAAAPAAGLLFVGTAAGQLLRQPL